MSTSYAIYALKEGEANLEGMERTQDNIYGKYSRDLVDGSS